MENKMPKKVQTQSSTRFFQFIKFHLPPLSRDFIVLKRCFLTFLGKFSTDCDKGFFPENVKGTNIIEHQKLLYPTTAAEPIPQR